PRLPAPPSRVTLLAGDPRLLPTRRRHAEREASARRGVAIDDDEVRLPRRHRRGEARGSEKARRVGARIIVTAAGKLAPRGTRAVADVEDRVEVRAGPAGLDRGCSGQVRGPLIDALRGAARPARPRLRAAPAGRAAEGAATGRNH